MHNKMIVVNRLLGQSPRFLGLPQGVIQAEVPVFLVVSPLLWWFSHISLKHLLLLNGWWIATFWLISGGDAYRFFSQFNALSYRPWCRGFELYYPILSHEKPNTEAQASTAQGSSKF